MKASVSSGSIPWKLIAVFLVLVVGIGIAARLYYVGQREHVTQSEENELRDVATSKIAQIVAWRSERLADAKSIAEDPYLRECATLSQSAVQKISVARKVQRWLRSYALTFGYAAVEIIDPSGKPCLSDGSTDNIDSSDVALVQTAIQTRTAIFSDLHREGAGANVYCHAVVPILPENPAESRIVGAVFLRIDAAEFLYPLLQSWPATNSSAELLLVERAGDDVTYLSQLKHTKMTTLDFRRPLADTNLLAAKALGDSEGILEGYDYRGIPVMAAAYKIPDSQWRLIAKVDREEVYAAMQERSVFALLVVVVLTVLAALLLSILWRQQRAELFRKSFELELKRRVVEEHFETLMRFANDGILILDLSGRVLEVNEKASSLYGWDRAEFVGMDSERFVAKDERIDNKKRFEEVDKSSGLVFESRHVRKDGSMFPVEVSARIIVVEGTRVYQIIVRDISDRKLAEQRLREMEERFRSLIENTDDLIAVTDPDGFFVFMSPSMERALGCSLEEARTRRFEEFLHLNDLAPTLAVRRQAIENPLQAYAVNHRLKCQDGIWLQAESHLKYMRLAKGKGEIIINSRDIGERNQALEALRLSEEKFSKAFRTNPDAISISRLRDGTFLEVNDGFTSITGRTKDQVIGKSSSDIDLWSNPEDLKRFVRMLVRTGEVTGYEAEFRMNDGSKRTALVSAKLLDVRGDRWIISVTRDITERKRSERRLAENEERMRVALEAAHIIVFNQDSNLRYTWMNIPDVGYSPDEIIG
jgi:PAS domain S-box-containing protein